MRRRVQLPFLGVALLLIALGAIVFGLFASSSVSQRRVLGATRDIAPGEVISAADLAVVDVSAPSGTALVPETARGSCVGQRAAVGIPKGSLLSPASVRSGGAVDPGSAVVAIVIAPGTAPVVDLRMGDRVQIVGTAASGTDATPKVLAVGDVVAVNAIKSGPTTSGSLSVSVRVPQEAGAAVASAAAADKARLVLIAAGG
jgi:hypothetical protein